MGGIISEVRGTFTAYGLKTIPSFQLPDGACKSVVYWDDPEMPWQLRFDRTMYRSQVVRPSLSIFIDRLSINQHLHIQHVSHIRVTDNMARWMETVHHWCFAELNVGPWPEFVPAAQSFTAVDWVLFFELIYDKFHGRNETEMKIKAQYLTGTGNNGLR